MLVNFLTFERPRSFIGKKNDLSIDLFKAHVWYDDMGYREKHAVFEKKLLHEVGSFVILYANIKMHIGSF